MKLKKNTQSISFKEKIMNDFENKITTVSARNMYNYSDCKYEINQVKPLEAGLKSTTEYYTRSIKLNKNAQDILFRDKNAQDILFKKKNMNDFENKITVHTRNKYDHYDCKYEKPSEAGLKSSIDNYKRSIIDDYLKEHFDLSLKELQELIEKYEPERLI
jgi:hypothetical protein